ncbi:thiamine-phosphate kinase [Zavarzinella formosa]|uniref:thiamine-phosphate kinase n=1 Tax=Zavarzinella formosa TaxID=360055 RepID=UPI000317BF05|nr:thiamine-phosphate kinase [Zavarzinella formosa]
MATAFPGEFAFIEWVKKDQPDNDSMLVGIGDDCAVLAPSSRATLVTTDMLMEGSCFRLAEAGPYRVGRKAMAVNISDIAAMAGTPKTAFVSLGLPQSMSFEDAKELHRGLQSMAGEFGVVIAGGDTNTWDGGLTISVTLLGEVIGRGAVLRNGAKPGDWIFVTGPLGGSILGHHLDFTPRVDFARRLHEQVKLHAMIDISDGLAKDLHRIVTASGVGAELEAINIPITDDARRMSAQNGKTALEHALGDGEDFELAFTVSEEDGKQLLETYPPDRSTLRMIGRIVESGFWLLDGGHRHVLAPVGYEHHFGQSTE